MRAARKRQRSSEPEEPTTTQTTVMDSASVVVEFKVNYEQLKPLGAVGESETTTIVGHSEAISAGGHTWTISFLYKRGRSRQLPPVSFGALLCPTKPSTSSGVRSRSSSMRCWTGKQATCSYWNLDSTRGTRQQWHKDGQLTFLCTITVLNNSHPAIPAPPSDICKHLGALLDATDGTGDVSFTVDGETFRAHRAVLAARSPVFRAELFGSMAESKMPSVNLQDIAPATFKAMLGYMYTDVLPRDDELGLGGGGSSSQEMFERLLAAADRYALDRLKLLCAQKLWDNVSVDTVASVLRCAEIYSCPELKSRCVGFFAQEKNFKTAVLTEGFVRLVQQFPSIILELRGDNAGGT